MNEEELRNDHPQVARCFSEGLFCTSSEKLSCGQGVSLAHFGAGTVQHLLTHWSVHPGPPIHTTFRNVPKREASEGQHLRM